MDKIEKFLRKLSKKDRKYLLSVIFPKIGNLELKGLGAAKVRGFPLWKIRHGKIRILFAKTNDRGIIVRIGYRKDIYKELRK